MVGAGSMSALAVATAHRLGAASIVVTNRTPSGRERLAESRVRGTTAGFAASCPPRSSRADLVISCTGAAGLVITAEMAADALRLRRLRRGGGNAAAGHVSTSRCRVTWTAAAAQLPESACSAWTRSRPRAWPSR